jgi:Protein of unknown function (DUF2804)
MPSSIALELTGDGDGASRLPLFHGGRPLKRWRYVGVFCEELMACAALVQVGPAKQSFWAVYTRADGRLRQRTHTLPWRTGAVKLLDGRARASAHAGGAQADEARTGGVRADEAQASGAHAGGAQTGLVDVHDGGVELCVSLEEDEGIQARCPHDGGGKVWTRKQAGVRAHGTLALDSGPPRAIEALATIDDTAGYHARRTEWWWSAGVGTGADGVTLAWNLVAGVNDPASGSERAVWVDGEPTEVAPVRFAADLREVLAQDGSKLSFAPEAERRRRENRLIVSSDYTAPFGTFGGTLPGGTRLARGLGVMEHHRARW